MVALLAIVKKAASFGYKRYGVPGAIATTLIALGGYYYLKKALSGSKTSEN
ncbi:hypothetical protein [Halalkalicoccus sp. NIPERK01]|uniref:hypothetical protein n=1 Tax=Halalkalicoccus sp. NIPERK01 TaxID=3053469 RepID=UPI00256EE9B8|nr:hypothetical protein [Halalkalicoccus sp. NIPERK01]MDL5361004.1 hypothetical protein [Halalkalicoccus sp. NIPERK01]